MEAVDHKPRRADHDDDALYPRTPLDIPHPGPPPVYRDRMDPGVSGYTLMVAGRRAGKSSFLRLLLDTSLLSQDITHDQLAALATFVHGCTAHTPHLRSVSVDIDLAPADNTDRHPLALTLIDTPSLDFDDEPAYQRTVADIIRHVDARFLESVEDDRKALAGDHHVHLCIYFLDPDQIVPPSVPAQPASASRARTNSLSHPDTEPFILDASNLLHCRPTLPAADIATIRRLSSRVNVLPVVACADTLTNERLSAVKMAIRRDLAEAGIGFGIFDVDTFPQYPQHYQDSVELSGFQSNNPDRPPNGYHAHANGATTSSAATSPPSSSPTPPSFLRLPFALISPDIYSHSDGVSRNMLSRQELVREYAPSHQFSKNQSLSKIVPGKFVRSYRWGFLDVLDAAHCDFLALRGAIFHHMQTLRKYTREYLLDKFRGELQLKNPSALHGAPNRVPQASSSMAHLPPLGNGARPALVIDTAPPHANGTRRASLSVSHAGGALNGDAGSAAAAPAPAETSPRTATSSRSQRQRAKKITVACNFCRSRKLKCDGGRPACSQCFKRSNPCDYMVNHKRRGNGRQRKAFAGSESEGESADERSAETEAHPSQSPELVSQPPSRRNSGGSMLLLAGEALPPLSAAIEQREEGSTTLAPINHAPPPLLPPEARPELPPIAALAAGSARAQAAAQQEEPMLSTKAADAEATQRRRTSSAASAKSRASNHGSKIVACNICRARKTRCDGAHPVCGSCARRSLACNYVNEPGSAKGRGKGGGGGTPPGPSASTSSRSSPAVQLQFPSGAVGVASGFVRAGDGGGGPPHKKMRLGAEMGVPALAVGVGQAP